MQQSRLYYGVLVARNPLGIYTKLNNITFTCLEDHIVTKLFPYSAL